MSTLPTTSTEDADRAWPAQLTLPGQAAAHPGPVDMAMMYVAHHAFRRDLVAFAAAAEATPAGDRACWAALARRWELFAEALHHHHAGEDAALWPVLLARVDDAGRAVLEEMEAEHAEIDPLLEASRTGFARLAAHADEDARRALAVRLVAARERMGAHLRHEEVDAIALVQRVLTAEEWERMDEEHFGVWLTLRKLVDVVPWALVDMPARAREELFAKPGGRLHRLVWMLTRRSFDRRERVAFRHLP